MGDRTWVCKCWAFNGCMQGLGMQASATYFLNETLYITVKGNVRIARGTLLNEEESTMLYETQVYYPVYNNVTFQRNYYHLYSTHHLYEFPIAHGAMGNIAIIICLAKPWISSTSARPATIYQWPGWKSKHTSHGRVTITGQEICCIKKMVDIFNH